MGSNPTKDYGLYSGMVDTLEVVKNRFSNLCGAVIKKEFRSQESELGMNSLRLANESRGVETPRQGVSSKSSCGKAESPSN